MLASPVMERRSGAAGRRSSGAGRITPRTRQAMRRAPAPAVLAALAWIGVGGDARAAVPLDDDSNEAQLMGYYAAALSFTPLGAPAGRMVEAALDATYLPSLS